LEIGNIKDCLKYFYLTNEWHRLSEKEKLAVLQVIENEVARRDGRESYTVVSVDFDDINTRGECDDETKTIRISSEILKNEPLYNEDEPEDYDVVSILLHEGFHAYQYQVINGSVEFSYNYKKEKWNYELNNYITYEENHNKYAGQLVEVNARRFAMSYKITLELLAREILVSDYYERKNKGEVIIVIEGNFPDSNDINIKLLKLLKIEARMASERKYLKKIYEEYKDSKQDLFGTMFIRVENDIESIKKIMYKEQENLFKGIYENVYNSGIKKCKGSVSKAKKEVKKLYIDCLQVDDNNKFIEGSYKILDKLINETTMQLAKGVKEIKQMEGLTLCDVTSDKGKNILGSVYSKMKKMAHREGKSREHIR